MDEYWNNNKLFEIYGIKQDYKSGEFKDTLK
jgi:hypothetical protein